MRNEMEVTFLSDSRNEAFARATVAAFIVQLDPTLDELNEVKTVVSEAVTNAIIHGYLNRADCYITLRCLIDEGQCEITITDTGLGIKDITLAKEPLYTSKPHLERSGMGFSIMESFMDGLEIKSEVGQGTTVIMKKQFQQSKTPCH